MTWTADSSYTLSPKRSSQTKGQEGDAYVILQRRIYRYTAQTNVNVIGRKREKKLVCWAMLFLNLSFCIHWRIITKGAGLTLLLHGESPCFFAMCPIYLACVATKTRGRDQRVWVRALLIGAEGTAPARITRLVQKGKITSLTFLKMFCVAVNNKWNLACCCCNLQPKTIKGEMVFNLIKPCWCWFIVREKHCWLADR